MYSGLPQIGEQAGGVARRLTEAGRERICKCRKRSQAVVQDWRVMGVEQTNPNCGMALLLRPLPQLLL